MILRFVSFLLIQLWSWILFNNLFYYEKKKYQKIIYKSNIVLNNIQYTLYKEWYISNKYYYEYVKGKYLLLLKIKY